MYRYYILTFLIACGVSLLLTPLVRRLSLRMGWLDKPNWRKINKKPMPLVGGLALYIGFAVSLLFVIFQEPFRQNSDKFFGFLASSFIIVLIGIADDTKGLTPRRKLFYQIVASTIAVMCGYTIFKVSNPLGAGYFHIPILLAVGLTIVWIVGFTNAVNLMDGLDGLAAGVTTIIATSLFFSTVKGNNPTAALLSIALAGSCLGFLRHNFYPAKIFMGDTGSMFLGFALALISIEGAYKGATLVTLIIPIIAMGVPLADTALSILRRLISGNSVFNADKEHIHHKLLIREGTQRKAVLTLYFLTISFGLIAIALSGMKGVWAFFAILITAILTLRWIINAGLVDFIRKINGD
ncbi:MAG: MraY family glycosyltransferase [Candidatus Omnitrophota bacterium]|nr:MraY family glycosyltransferase [Candidatus Omnitrophota bacterium]